MSKPSLLSSPATLNLSKLLDATTIFLAGYLALHIRSVLPVPFEYAGDLSGYYSLIIVGSLLFVALSKSMYRSWRGAQSPAMLAQVIGSWLIVVGLILL